MDAELAAWLARIEQKLDRLIGADKNDPRKRAKLASALPTIHHDLPKLPRPFRAAELVAEIGDDSFGVVDNIGDKFLIRTDKGAPNGRVVLVDPKNPDPKNWKDILPERAEPLQGSGTAGFCS